MTPEKRLAELDAHTRAIVAAKDGQKALDFLEAEFPRVITALRVVLLTTRKPPANPFTLIRGKIQDSLSAFQ